MIDIQWKGKVGYGDIVSPICYAHNISNKLQVPVNLTFRWGHGPEHKIHPHDPETLWERASYIGRACYKGSTQVAVFHKFKNPLDINHTNYDWDIVGKDQLHNYWFPTKPNRTQSNLIVVNSTQGNSQSLKEYGKEWKDPAAPFWPKIIERIQQRGFEVEVVDYRTSVHHLINILRQAKGFVGYHGTAAWPAKFMHVPSVLFADGGSLTSRSFCYAFVERHASRWKEVVDNLDSYLSYSQQKIEETKKAYKTYMPSKKFLGHLVYGF